MKKFVSVFLLSFMLIIGILPVFADTNTTCPTEYLTRQYRVHLKLTNGVFMWVASDNELKAPSDLSAIWSASGYTYSWNDGNLSGTYSNEPYYGLKIGGVSNIYYSNTLLYNSNNSGSIVFANPTPTPTPIPVSVQIQTNLSTWSEGALLSQPPIFNVQSNTFPLLITLTRESIVNGQKTIQLDEIASIIANDYVIDFNTNFSTWLTDKNSSYILSIKNTDSTIIYASKWFQLDNSSGQFSNKTSTPDMPNLVTNDYPYPADGDFFQKLLYWFGYPLYAIQKIITYMSQGLQLLSKNLGDFGNIIKNIFAFLPPEISIILVLGITTTTIIAIVRYARGV